MLKCLNAKMEEKGFAALFVTVLIMAIILGIGLSVAIFVLGEQKIAYNITKSSQAYYAAEAGIEDALLRLSKSKKWSSSYGFGVGDGSVGVEISDEIGGTRTITATGNFANRIRKIQVVYGITSQDVAFYFGIQVGDLGLGMDGNAVVHGNVFSNGHISGASNTKIYGNAISAKDGGLIKSMKILSSEGGGSAWANRLEDCTIDNDAFYNEISSCSVGGTHYMPIEVPEPQDMPITNENIQAWKSEAAAGGTIFGYSLGGNNTDSLGPIKVEGDMTLDSNAELTITGTIWVTGNLSLNSNVKLQLDPGYGNFSGVIVVDGRIFVDSNVVLCGSEGFKEAEKECYPSIGSYLMLLSINNSIDPNNPAIYATSNTETAILYTSAGFIRLSSNAKLREATGYGIYMDSNAEVTYEIGLADARFSSGPGGTKKVKSWREIE